jgi:MFS family permease
MGGFCQPVDSSANNKLWQNHILSEKVSLLGGYSAIMWALAIGTCIGVIYLIAVVLLPRMMTYVAFILAFACLLTAGILLLVQPIKLLSHDSSTWNVIIGIVMIAVAVCLLVFFFCYQQEIELASIFINYANVFLKENFIVFAYVPLYMLLSFGLFVLCVWQFIAFGSYEQPYINQGDLYYSSGKSMVLQVLNAIEFIWGIQFLRDSCKR